MQPLHHARHRRRNQVQRIHSDHDQLRSPCEHRGSSLREWIHSMHDPAKGVSQTHQQRGRKTLSPTRCLSRCQQEAEKVVTVQARLPRRSRLVQCVRLRLSFCRSKRWSNYSAPDKEKPTKLVQNFSSDWMSQKVGSRQVS